jgi:hypothetical protein
MGTKSAFITCERPRQSELQATVSDFSSFSTSSDAIAQKASETIAPARASDSPLIYSQIFLSRAVSY